MDLHNNVILATISKIKTKKNLIFVFFCFSGNRFIEGLSMTKYY